MTTKPTRSKAAWLQMEREADAVARGVRAVMAGRMPGLPGAPNAQNASGPARAAEVRTGRRDTDADVETGGIEYGCSKVNPEPCFNTPEGLGDAFTAGGRNPTVVPSPFGTGVIPDEQVIFEWDADRCLKFRKKLLYDPCFVANVFFRLASVSNDQFDPVVDDKNQDATDAFLRVHYGSDNHGPDSFCEFDLAQGTSIPLIGRRARFSVVYPGKNPDTHTQPILDVSISIGVGGSGLAAQARAPRRTIFLGDIGAGNDSAIVATPPFAQGAIYISNDATTTMLFKQTVAPFTGSAVIAQSALSKIESQSVAVRSGARGFLVTANAGAITGGAVIFFLAPG